MCILPPPLASNFAWTHVLAADLSFSMTDKTFSVQYMLGGYERNIY